MNDTILNKLRILYVEDDLLIQKNTLITLELLNAKVLCANNGKQGLEVYRNNIDEIDIIITDISMPLMNGLDMAEEIQNINRNIPVIITTAHQDINYLKKAIELGITSYILKPIKIEQIIKSIEKALEPIRLKEALLKKNEELIILNSSLEEKISKRTKELENLASTDHLTGINNRRSFFKLVKKKFEQSTNLYIVMIDIDNFKIINDIHGHQIGDEILTLTARDILEKLNTNDIFARFGGEEFVIAFECEDDSFIKKIEEIRVSIQNLKYKDISFTISLGVSSKYPQDKNIDWVINRADKAMYQAKKSGKNKTVFGES